MSGLAAQRILEVLSQAQVGLCAVTAHAATLEDVYLQLTSDEVDYRAAPSEARP